MLDSTGYFLVSAYGQSLPTETCFDDALWRRYVDSSKDHSKFLTTNESYVLLLLQQRKIVRECKNLGKIRDRNHNHLMYYVYQDPRQGF
jgi:hypothetical protein